MKCSAVCHFVKKIIKISANMQGIFMTTYVEKNQDQTFSAPMQQKSRKLRISLWLYYTYVGSPSPLAWMGRIETNLLGARLTE
jgi:hypothetical protein